MNAIASPAPAWLRIVALLGLLWNAFGCYAYLQTVGVLSGGEAAMTAMPAWVTGAFAIAVFGGVLGCLGLLMLKSWSRLLLILSLLAVIAQTVWLFGMSGAAPSGSALGLPIAVILISLVLAWLAHDGAKKGWLS
jgi:vacuolar-type H+-ATPase subunit I/STV1